MTEPTEPPYRRIVAELRRQITAGELAPGERVPSTRRIAQDWGVALATATRALASLREEGYVQAQPRVGTVVAARPTGGETAGRPTGTAGRADVGTAGRADVGTAGRADAGGQDGRGSARAGGQGPGHSGTGRGAGDEDRRAGRTRRTGTDSELTRDRVVRAAIEIADTEGLAALSMRGVASRLGVATMSTYRHVASKDELILLMADAAFGEEGYPPPHPAGWRARIERAVRTMWRLHRRHPWLAQLSPLSRPLPLMNLLMHGDQILAALTELGFDATTRLDLQVLLYSYVQGLAVQLEWEADAQAATGLSGDEYLAEKAPDLARIAATGRSPAFSTLLAELPPDGYDFDLDRLFEFGLRTMLDGLTLLARPAPGT